MNLEPGSVLGGRYSIRRELGRGGAAVVFVAQHLFTTRDVALKLPHTDPAEYQTCCARLQRELWALGRVQHDNIVDVYDGGDLDGGPFIAMELLDGRPLSGLIAARGKLSIAETIKVGIELSRAVGAVHAAGLLHRDIKPSNVHVTTNTHRQTRLLDFGLAKPTGATTETKLTQPGAIVGTPEYMAPEALFSAPDQDERVDIYSIGASLYECLTGAAPHEGHLGEIVMHLSSGESPSVRKSRPDVPEALAAVIARCLQRSRDARYSNTQQLAADLARCHPQPLTHIDVLRTTAATPPPLPTAASAVNAVPGANPNASAANANTSAAEQAASRREHARAAYVTLARVFPSTGGTIDGRLEDISTGGVLFLGNADCQQGESVRLRFAMPISGQIAEVETVCRWVRSSRNGRATGLSFVNLPDAATAEIDRYVKLMTNDRDTATAAL